MNIYYQQLECQMDLNVRKILSKYLPTHVIRCLCLAGYRTFNVIVSIDNDFENKIHSINNIVRLMCKYMTEFEKLHFVGSEFERIGLDRFVILPGYQEALKLAIKEIKCLLAAKQLNTQTTTTTTTTTTIELNENNKRHNEISLLKSSSSSSSSATTQIKRRKIERNDNSRFEPSLNNDQKDEQQFKLCKQCKKLTKDNFVRLCQHNKETCQDNNLLLDLNQLSLKNSKINHSVCISWLLWQSLPAAKLLNQQQQQQHSRHHFDQHPQLASNGNRDSVFSLSNNNKNMKTTNRQQANKQFDRNLKPQTDIDQNQPLPLKTPLDETSTRTILTNNNNNNESTANHSSINNKSLEKQPKNSQFSYAAADSIYLNELTSRAVATLIRHARRYGWPELVEEKDFIITVYARYVQTHLPTLFKNENSNTKVNDVNNFNKTLVNSTASTRQKIALFGSYVCKICERNVSLSFSFKELKYPVLSNVFSHLRKQHFEIDSNLFSTTTNTVAVGSPIDQNKPDKSHLAFVENKSLICKNERSDADMTSKLKIQNHIMSIYHQKSSNIFQKSNLANLDQSKIELKSEEPNICKAIVSIDKIKEEEEEDL